MGTRLGWFELVRERLMIATGVFGGEIGLVIVVEFEVGFTAEYFKQVHAAWQLESRELVVHGLEIKGGLNFGV
jgi:hypothetical protein